MSFLFGSQKDAKSEDAAAAAAPAPAPAPTPAPDPSDPEADDEPQEKMQSSWTKLKKQVGRRGSLLRLNDEADGDDRDDLLNKLFVKRRLKDREMNKLAKTLTPKSQDATPSEVSELTDDSTLGQWDASFIKECQAEVNEEMDKDTESAKIQEINGIVGTKFQPLISHQPPLEVRMEDVTYTVRVDETSRKIKTVYNSSILYLLNNFVKRVWKCQPREKKEPTFQKVLAGINLVFKPGRQYLILGPPGAGKSTLLKAITDHLQLKKDETLTGHISYNGRTLQVREKLISRLMDVMFLVI